MSVKQVVNFLWKTIINWAVQPRLNTLPTLLAGPARILFWYFFQRFALLNGPIRGV